MTLGRRSILGLLGGAVAAGSKAAESAVAVFGQAAMGMPASAAVQPSQAGPMNPLAEAAYKLYREANDERDRRHIYRVNGLDADLYSLRLPLATKARMQRARDDAARSAIDVLREKWQMFR